jgi:hypothetical protein
MPEHPIFGPAQAGGYAINNRNHLQRIWRSWNRLRRQGLPMNVIQNRLQAEIKALLGAGAVSSYAVGKMIEQVISYDGSFINRPARAKGIKRLRGTEPELDKNKKPMDRDPRGPHGREYIRKGDGDVDMEPQAAAVATAVPKREGFSTRGSAKGHGETSISPYDFVQIGIPKCATTKLPFRKIAERQAITVAQTPLVLAVRMNSIYDILGSGTYAADPAAVADATSGTVETPKWRGFFADKYQYYTVLGCDYKIKFRVRPQSGGAFPGPTLPNCNDFAVYMYKCGLQRPPTNVGTAVIPHGWKILHTGVDYQRLPGPKFSSDMGSTPGGVVITEFDGNTQGWTTFSGHVGIGDIKHEVTEDELQQTWHKMSEVPPTPELLVFHIQKDEFNTGETDPYVLDYVIECTYLTQFKDIKAQYQYPTQETAFAAITAATLGGTT